MTAQSTGPRDLLRHTVATVAYRGAKALRGAPPEFASFRVGPTSRTPLEILVHLGDLFDWALSMAEGKPAWHDSAPKPWPEEVERFHRALAAFDARLASDAPLGYPIERLFQGPVADALTHVGQINLLRRMAGSPVRGESYNRADITVGRVGPDQAPPTPRSEFD